VSEETTQKQGNPTNTRPNPEATGDMFPVPRTKKVKELQKRLGVGRPVAVGGTGPRAVTRSTTISSERLRSNRSMQKIEATIQEGEPLSIRHLNPQRYLDLIILRA
jgi:hypothetical protein